MKKKKTQIFCRHRATLAGHKGFMWDNKIVKCIDCNAQNGYNLTNTDGKSKYRYAKTHTPEHIHSIDEKIKMKNTLKNGKCKTNTQIHQP